MHELRGYTIETQNHPLRRLLTYTDCCKTLHAERHSVHNILHLHWTVAAAAAAAAEGGAFVYPFVATAAQAV